MRRRMSTASGRVLIQNCTVGTAWRFHERYALTAAHCLVGDDAKLLPELVHVQFTGHRPLEARARINESLDAALLEFVEPVPAGVYVLELAHRPPRKPSPPLTPYRWSGIAYPLVSDFQQTIIGGDIRGYVE